MKSLQNQPASPTWIKKTADSPHANNNDKFPHPATAKILTSPSQNHDAIATKPSDSYHHELNQPTMSTSILREIEIEAYPYRVDHCIRQATSMTMNQMLITLPAYSKESALPQ
ncbi:hypothetical protein V6N13_013894 [Hibiscus sabdariffa]|uniref:Uncharacterized protein n=1 Tax=Hibiscus sabdariffa TaxID=183260 RepID=A0ABR2RTN2_9ROSI